jgi:hypothetical protein
MKFYKDFREIERKGTEAALGTEVVQGGDVGVHVVHPVGVRRIVLRRVLRGKGCGHSNTKYKKIGSLYRKKILNCDFCKRILCRYKRETSFERGLRRRKFFSKK